MTPPPPPPPPKFYLFLHTTSPTVLTHWGRVTHICVSKLTLISSDNSLSPGRRQAIVWTNDGILLIRPLGTNFSEILSKIHTFSFNKMRLKVSSAKRRPFCFGLNVLIYVVTAAEYGNHAKRVYDVLIILRPLPCTCSLVITFAQIMRIMRCKTSSRNKDRSSPYSKHICILFRENAHRINPDNLACDFPVLRLRLSMYSVEFHVIFV